MNQKNKKTREGRRTRHFFYVLTRRICYLILKAMLSVYIALAIGGSLRGVGRSGAVLGNLFIQRWKKGTPSSERILS